MKRGLVLVAQSGLRTSLSWWANMRVEVDAVVLSSSSKEGWPDSSLVVAELRSEEEARAMFGTISQRILLKARAFDARDWPPPIRSQSPEAAAEDGT